MTVEEICKMANRKTEPECAFSFEWLLWYRMRDIYEGVRNGSMSKAEGAKEKEEAVRSYHHGEEQFERNILFWKRIEQAGIRYGKERTVEAADAFYEAVYGVSPGGKIREQET